MSTPSQNTFLAPPLQSQRDRPRPQLPSRAPDGVYVRVELLHSGSQELQQTFGEKVAACGPRHRGPCPRYSGRTSPRHHELSRRPEPAARAAGNWSRAALPREGAPGKCCLHQDTGVSGKWSLERTGRGGGPGRRSRGLVAGLENLQSSGCRKEPVFGVDTFCFLQR